MKKENSQARLRNVIFRYLFRDLKTDNYIMKLLGGFIIDSELVQELSTIKLARFIIDRLNQLKEETVIEIDAIIDKLKREMGE